MWLEEEGGDSQVATKKGVNQANYRGRRVVETTLTLVWSPTHASDRGEGVFPVFASKFLSWTDHFPCLDRWVTSLLQHRAHTSQLASNVRSLASKSCFNGIPSRLETAPPPILYSPCVFLFRQLLGSRHATSGPHLSPSTLYLYLCTVASSLMCHPRARGDKRDET